MKVILLLSLLAVASSYPLVKTWTLDELSLAYELHEEGYHVSTPDMTPYLEAALNEIMEGLLTDQVKTESVYAAIPSPTGAEFWTVQELKQAIEDPNTKPEYFMPLVSAQNGFKQRKNKTGGIEEPVQVLIPALDVATWSEPDLLEALNSPSTEAELRPYLEKAFNELREAEEEGETLDHIYTVTPVGLIPPKSGYDVLLKPSKQYLHKS